jgi:hypothetical protein
MKALPWTIPGYEQRVSTEGMLGATRLFLDKVEEEGERWKVRRIMAGEGSLFAAITK